MSAPLASRGTTAQHEAAERQLAARTLLAQPILTAHRQPAELALVRRHSTALRSMFAQILGYPLIVEHSFARLVKAPPSSDSPQRHVRRGDSPVFTPQTYALFTLACAALLAPGTGEQLLISSLIEQIRADAATARVDLQDTPAENRRLVQAIGLLIDWGMLTETDGSLVAWSERKEEALLTIHRPLLAHVLPRPLRGVNSLRDVIAQAPSELAEPRRSLRRKLVENPLVRREDLPADERDVLSRERSELTRLLEEHFGLTLEVRAEGAVAYDVEGTLSDVEFPGPGTVRQAALLLADALTDLGRPASGNKATGNTPAVQGLLTPWHVVDEELAHLVSRYAKAWSAAYVADLARLRGDVVALLESVSLGQARPDGLVLHPAMARYRPEPRMSLRSKSAVRPPSPQQTSAFADTALHTDILFDAATSGESP
ncbi:TIGR02678 family protein [Streptomyces sp. NPDC056528]|uniref:TIGR02678 family protein n=1 Tax=Streptomyces sp. NPDC056528 TaxID=3345854 RepID=UPI00368E1EFD